MGAVQAKSQDIDDGDEDKGQNFPSVEIKVKPVEKSRQKENKNKNPLEKKSYHYLDDDKEELFEELFKEADILKQEKEASDPEPEPLKETDYKKITEDPGLSSCL